MTRLMGCSSPESPKCLRINKESIDLSIVTDFPDAQDKDDSDKQESEQSTVPDKRDLIDGVIMSGNLMFG